MRDSSSAAALVVDDDDRERDVTAGALLDAGVAIIETTCGRQALNTLDHHPELGWLVTELTLPDLDGVLVAQLARRKRPDLRVLVLSADSARLATATAFGYAVAAKPIRRRDFIASVKGLAGP